MLYSSTVEYQLTTLVHGLLVVFYLLISGSFLVPLHVYALYHSGLCAFCSRTRLPTTFLVRLQQNWLLSSPIQQNDSQSTSLCPAQTATWARPCIPPAQLLERVRGHIPLTVLRYRRGQHRGTGRVGVPRQPALPPPPLPRDCHLNSN